MTDVIHTDRLTLRRHDPSDAADIARLIADWDVIKWLTSPPWPYTLADAEFFLSDGMSRETFAMLLGDAYVGNVGLHAVEGSTDLEFGYWLGKPFWGQGLMTEAATAVVADHFDHSDQHLISGYLLGNGPSRYVLTKLGFKNTQLVNRHSVPQDKDLPLQRMRLDKVDWQARHG